MISVFMLVDALGWEHRVVRKAVSVIGRRVSGARGYFQIYGIPAVHSYHQYRDAQAVRRAVSDIGNRAARFYFIYLAEGVKIPGLNPENPGYALAIGCWQKVPLPIANALGPWVVRNIPQVIFQC